MATALDLPYPDATAASSAPAQMMRAAQVERERKAAEEAAKVQRQAAEDARQEAQLKLSQESGQRAATAAQTAQQEAQNKLRTGTAVADVGEWTQDPRYQVPFAKAPEEAKRHFSIDTYGDAAPAARGAWDASLRQQGIPIDQPGPNEDITINPQGEATRRISAPPVSTAGQVTERDMAEAGLDPNAHPRAEWPGLLASKKQPVKAKLDVAQKSIIGAASQAVPMLADAMANYDKVAGRAGPIQGNISTVLNAAGMGSKEFAAANSELQANMFKIARMLNGAGVLTDRDMARMEKIAPSLRQNRGQFQGNVEAMKKLVGSGLVAWRDLNSSALDDSQRQLVERLIQQVNTPGSQAPIPAAPSVLPPAANSQNASQEAPQINSQQEYDALPSGAKYRDSRGNPATKR